MGTWPDFQVTGCQQTSQSFRTDKRRPRHGSSKRKETGADIETFGKCGRVSSASIGDDRGCCCLLGRSRLMWSQMNHNETQAGKVEATATSHTFCRSRWSSHTANHSTWYVPTCSQRSVAAEYYTCDANDRSLLAAPPARLSCIDSAAFPDHSSRQISCPGLTDQIAAKVFTHRREPQPLFVALSSLYSVRGDQAQAMRLK